MHEKYIHIKMKNIKKNYDRVFAFPVHYFRISAIG